MEPSASFVTRSPAPLAVARSTPTEPNAIEGPAHIEVSLVIVTYGTGRIVVDAIDRLARSLDGGPPFEIVVVDNPHAAAPNRSRNELALSTAGVRVLRASRNLGFGGGCELGALHARGRVLAFVNPDLLVEPGWLAPMLELVDQGAAIVAPVLVNSDGSVQEAGARVHADGSTSPLLDVDAVADGTIVPDYASAACWLLTREAHERSGGFDPAFHPAYYEDVDLSLRVAAQGGRLRIATGARVEHRRGTGTLDASATVDTSDQRQLVLERHPAVRWTRPPRDAATTW
jgi:GT2 family glycosyltransferase